MTKTGVCAAGLYCGLGLTVPIAPTVAACLAVVLVRVLVWTKTKSVVWNVTVCLLAMLAAGVTVEGSEINVFRAFWLGVGYGGLGVGIIEIGKSNVGAALKAGLQTMAKGILGTAPPKE